MVEELSNKHSVRGLCEFLEVSRSGYHAWKNGQESARAKANREVIEEIKQVFHTKRGRYGSPGLLTSCGGPDGPVITSELSD